METFEVRHRLDLVIQLLDTTTGKCISERNVTFSEEGKKVPFIYKGAGVYVLVDTIRKDTVYEVQVYGYEEGRISVAYGESNKDIPILSVPLIPKETKYSYAEVLTMTGRLDGIEELEAVRLRSADRTIRDFDSRKQVVNYFGGAELTEKEYGIVHKATMDFEVFQVKKVINKTAALIKQPLEMPYAVKDPIVRIVKGKVLPNHQYLLRVRDDGQEVVYLVRYVVNGNTYFKQVNFKKEEERKLEE